MGEYHPSYVKNTARSAVTTAASIPIDIRGSAAAEAAGGGAAEAAAGGERKQPMTSTMSITPTATLMMRVRVLPMRRPAQCSMENTAMTPLLMAFGAAAAAGHSSPMNTEAVSAA